MNYPTGLLNLGYPQIHAGGRFAQKKEEEKKEEKKETQTANDLTYIFVAVKTKIRVLEQ